MNIRDRLGSIFAFNTVPTTVLLVLVYAAIFSTVLVTDSLPPIPREMRGLDLNQAWWDLHQVAARPHPFNSHANDLVRDFILERLRNVVSQYPYVTIDYDTVSNASWATNLFSTRPRAVYQEGNNILVKVEGTDPAYRQSGGFLLSAHYDSVSTAPGTTDDSMGIVTLMQMVEHLVKHRPRKTVVFNFNNNEESGLNGAHAFLQHPWANISDVFLNLEGAAAGGRPVMFRATNIAPLFSWTSNHVPHPHANVLFADAFSRGVVRSATDYSVYEQAGLDGLDFAFYKGRSRYHTWYDSIAGMEGGKKALWAMMEATHGASSALANDDMVYAKPFSRQERPVYFELFGATLVVFSLEALFITNVVLLTTGPILLLLFAYSKHSVRLSGRIRPRHSVHANEDEVCENVAYGERTLTTLKRFSAGFWNLTKFWVALAISIGFQVALVAGYVNLNPFVIHSHPFLVFTSALSLAYLSTVLVVSFPCNIHGTVSVPEEQKFSILLQTYGFTWVLLVFSTIALRSAEIGSTYFITAWNICVLIGCVVGLFEATTRVRGFEPQAEVENEGRAFVEGVEYQATGTVEDANGQQSSPRIVEDPEPTETTPLVFRGHSPPPPPSEGQGAIGWWILQLLLVVPLPVILVFHLALMLLGAMNQTLTDGNSPALTYSTVSLLALLLILPLSPFGINVHRWFTLLVLAVFILSTVYTWIAFPFSSKAPLKVYFAQTVNLTASGTGVEHATTALTGPHQFLTRYLLPELPSAFGKSVECYNAPDKVGLQTCTWEVGREMLPSPGGNNTPSESISMPWVSYSINHTGPNSARIDVRGFNTRFCSLEFTNRRVSKFSIVGDGNKGLQKGYEIPKQGLSQIQLWSRRFGKRFEVAVEWEDEENGETASGLWGQASCGWDEYERATVGGGRSGGQIPSLEEVIQYLPEWAVVSKSTSALFSASRSFSI